MTLDVHRQWYARLTTANAGLPPRTDGIFGAFASTRREQFLGPGPWQVFTRIGYVETPNDDPALIYQDVAVALKPEGRINNGQPSLHAVCLSALGITDGETIVHVGSGTGYYTAILATLAGSAGRVFAYEVDETLAVRAAENLKGYANVEVRSQSGADQPLPPADVIYVNAGATEPLRVWIDALRTGGRLLFPLTPAQGAGFMLLVTRTSTDQLEARFVCSAAFTPCVGARDDETAKALTDAFVRGGIASVQSLQIDRPPDDSCWFAGRRWWLSSAAAH